MPKIEIKDIDLTVPALNTDYANFTVAVIGPVKNKAKFATYADTNGVYNSANATGDALEEFITAVGIVPDTGVERAFAEAEVLTVGGQGIAKYQKTLTQTDFEVKYSGKVYTATARVTELPATAGKNILQVKNNDDTYSYYDLTKATAWDASTNYVVINYIGNNTITFKNVYGNQIAYELIRGGCPVLYYGYEQLSDIDSGTLSEDNKLSVLLDRTEYDFRFILSGINSSVGVTAAKYSNINSTLAYIAETRGDCIALLDVDENIYDTTFNSSSPKTKIATIAEEINAMPTSTNVAIFTPAVTFNNLASSFVDGYNENKVLPASFYYLACFFNAQQNGYAEWFATAGELRGRSAYSVAKTTVTLGDLYVQALEPRNDSTTIFKKDSKDVSLQAACNIIAKYGTNYILWGNRTSAKLEEELRASHFLNIRQLVTTLKKQLYIACRRFSFDPNSDVLWNNFYKAITPTLERMKGNEGIRNYQVLKIDTDLKATLKARIRIVPIEAVEDFDITISLEDDLNSLTIGDTTAE